MIQRLLPDGVASNWKTISPLVGDAMEDHLVSVEVMSRVLFAILKEEVEVWLYHHDDETRALLLISYRKQPILQEKEMIIHTLTSIRSISTDDSDILMEDLEDLAKARDCAAIVGYATYKPWIRFLRSVGFDTEQTYVYLEVT